MESNKKQTTYKQLVQKVKRIINFYNYLQIFVIMMLVLALFSDIIIEFFEIYISNENTLYWVKLNIWIQALLWFVGLSFQGIVALRYNFNSVDHWGKKKVEAYRNENN